MTRILVAAIIALCALAPSVGSADHIPGNVSQREKFGYASAGWRFDEPDGSFRIVTVKAADRTIIAKHGLRHRYLTACVRVRSLVMAESGDPADSVFREVFGCGPLKRSQFHVVRSLGWGRVKTTVATEECVSIGDPRITTCGAGPTLEAQVEWEANDPLEAGPWVGGNDVCHVRGRNSLRHHLVRGFVRSGGIDYTSGRDGTGFMFEHFTRVRVVPEGSEDCMGSDEP